MGRCHEFGSQIREGCGHPMRAGERACACPECGVVCEGQFDGCPDVWARGPRPVSLSIAPAIAAPRVRALAPGPAAPQPAPAAAPANVNGNGNGNGNGSTAGGNGYAAPTAPPPPPPPPPPSAPPPPSGTGTGTSRPAGPAPGATPAGSPARTEVLRWFEDAFDQLRNELHAVVSGVTRQQAMLAELLDSREAELRVVMLAESLPELAGEAAAKALNDQQDSLADEVAATLDEFRASLRAADLSTTAVMDGMRELLRRVEVTAEANAEDARLEGDARLESLKRSVGRQLKPVTAAVSELSAYMEAAEEREAARTKALKASITRQLQPMAAAVAEAVERSDRQLAEIHARLDAVGAPERPAGAPKRTPAKKPAAKKPAATTKAATRKAAARTAAPAEPAPARKAKPQPRGEAIAIVYDYETPARKAAPAPVLESLLARRRAEGRRKPPLAQ
jgi:hypothetical protein